LTYARAFEIRPARTRFWIEAAHVGPRAFGHKCPDRETLPICRWDHRIGPNSHHRMGKKFWEFWKLDRESLILELNETFEQFNC